MKSFLKFAVQVVDRKENNKQVNDSPTPEGEGGNGHFGIRRFCALVLTI